MQTIYTKKRMIDFPSYVQKPAAKEDCSKFITEPCMVYVDGLLSILYFDISHIDTRDFLDALVKLEFHNNQRSSGMKTQSRVFGYLPRRPLGRGDFCAPASLDRDFPEYSKIISAFVQQLLPTYKDLNPSLYKQHEKLASKILPDYKINGLYSSGIVNKDNPLPYHFDRGNIPNCYSIMPVFKKDIEGGHLSLPQLDMCFELRDHTCFMFDGQNTLHGVTPFKKMSEAAYRYTVVYYTMVELWQCLEPNAELLRAQNKRTEIEKRHAKNELHPQLQKKLKKLGLK